ncbi:unnamed protein product [Brassicogethes aeneus]|uniref:Aminopeptidase n=1 Tax=Brassicogethes aeneus TaxID=1431903 RepID=A0A9P0B1W4_BRAAE|nr:unnamed protein product [Brassicogethes aeneus]
MQPRPSTQQFQIQSTLAKIMLLGGLNLCLICALIWATDAQKEYRLPQNIYPESYFINLTIDADAFTANNDDFKGEVGIVIVVKEATNNISIHKSDTLSITKILFDSAEIKITETTFYNETTQILNITIPDNLNVNDRHILNITYDGKFTSDMLGFYKSSYEDRGKTKYLLTTQFQATFARRAFPCFDEPEFKSVFNLTVTHPNTTTVLSNTDVNKTIANGFKNTTTFNSTPKMSSYLVAFIISEFSCNKYAGLLYTMVPQRVCSRDGVNHTTREWALNEGVSILNMLNQYTKIYYTDYNNKMDQVAIPDFTAGAMENWGLVTYRERSLLWSDTDSSNRYKQTISAIVAHEFAHMWFGNLVTSRWWNTIFLNEGFARYFQYILTGILHNDWQMENQFVVEQLQLAMAADDIPTAQALQQDAYTPPAISARFGTISYSKGASVFRMVSHFLGGEMFKKGLQFYLNERLDPNLQGIVFCNALRYTNDTEDWHFLWNLYKTTDVSTEKVTLLGALGCTENKNLLKTYLEHSINENSGIKPQDALSVFSAVQTSQIGVNIALQFLKNNYASIQSSYKSLNALSNLIEQLADKFTTKEQLEELQNFIDELKKKPGDFTDFISTAEISLKAAEANIQWVENLGEYLFNYYNINDNDDNNNNNNPGSSSTIHMSFVVIVPGLVFLLFK